MATNTNNPSKSVGAMNAFGSSGIGGSPQGFVLNHQNHLVSQPQTQVAAAQYPGHFKLSEPQAQAMAQAQYAQVQAHAQAQASHAQFQAQLQAQLHNAGTANIGVSSPSVSVPGAGSASAKRTAQKPPSKPPGVSNATTVSPFKTMELTPAACRKKQKLSDKQIPDKVAAILPESALYTQLLEFEARVDASLLRKKIDIQESLKNPPRVQKTLRIYVFNTFTNQTSALPGKNAESPSWTLRIIGRILEDGVDPVTSGNGPKPSTSPPKFSSLFKRITIYLDQSLYPDNHVILWESARSPALHEGFEVKRKGDKEFTARIRLEMNYVPEKFKLSPALTEVLGIEVETRPRIIAAIWHYVKARRLQTQDDPSFFMCDPALRKVFGEEKLKFNTISQKISQHLSPPQPIHVEHKIKLSGNSPVGNTCYDVLVDVPFPLEKEMSAFLSNMEKHKEIDACDEAISVAIKKIHEHRRRRAFFLGFSQSPTEFINTLITSQSKDLKLAAGDASRHAEKERRSDFFNQPWKCRKRTPVTLLTKQRGGGLPPHEGGGKVEDAVIHYLNRKSTGSDAPGST